MSDAFTKHGAFGWFELMTTDASAAKQFYTKLFGWQLQENPMGNMSYTLIQVDQKPTGGIAPIPGTEKGIPPHWGVYITVDDVDATAQQAEALGGTILVGPMDIPQVGRFCVIRDPQGAVISAITYCTCPDH